MDSKVFAQVIAKVVESNESHELNDHEKASFHQELENNIACQVDKLRFEKRKAYEEYKTIAVL